MTLTNEVKNISIEIIDTLESLQKFEITGLLLGKQENYDELKLKVSYLNELLERRELLMEHITMNTLFERI